MKNGDDVNCEGGPAFPVSIPGCGDNGWQGMTLRDWFAGQVNTGGYQFPDTDAAAKALNIEPPFDDSLAELLRFSFRAQAAIRYAYADAMLAERSKP